jgi:peptide/nickel transport system substrate-binding protein
MLSRLPLILLTAALGCSGGGEPAAPEVAAGGPTESRGPGSEPSVDELGGPRDTLVLGFKNDADTLLSVVAQTATDGELLTMLNLQTLDSEFDCELKFKPLIAESFGFNEDQTVLSMTLRDDIRWSDGVPFTAKDIALAYELVSDPAVASPRLASVEHMAVDARPKVIDDHHIEFHFEQPYNRTTMLAHASLVQAVPAHLLADADRATLRGNPLVRDPVVNGPWKIQSWRPGESITLVPNENYSGPEEYRPRLKRIIYKIVPEYATRLIELENGDIDWMQELSVADADRLMAEHPEVKLHRRGWRFMDYVAWNSLDPADYKARRARSWTGPRSSRTRCSGTRRCAGR